MHKLLKSWLIELCCTITNSKDKKFKNIASLFLCTYGYVDACYCMCYIYVDQNVSHCRYI